MKRGKVFSILASAAMVFGLSTPLNVSAQETSLPEPVNGVITLTDDVNLAATQVINQDVTLDLNGHNISSIVTVLEVNNGATLTVKDTTANSRPNVVNNSSVENYKSGKIQSTNNNGIKVLNNSKLILSNGIIQAKNLGVGVVGNTSTSSDEVKSSFEMNGGYILSQEFSVCVYGSKATFTLNNGVLESKDNTCIGNNGSISKDEDMGGTEININGGNIIGHIQSNGYIANGISQANYGTLNISGGVIYADGGCGVIARAGKVNITGGKIIATGINSGYIGDRKDSVQCNGVVLDAQAQYPGWDYNGNNAEINITGDVEVLANSSCKAIEAMGESKSGVTAKSRFKVSAGTYSSDVSDYVDNFFNKSYKIGDYYKVLPPALDIDTSDTEGMINGVLSIELGKEKTINAVVKPFNTPDKATFSSNNEKVATVDENGKVTALSTGVAVITIQAGNMETTVNVSVYKVEEPKEAPVVDTKKTVEEVTAGVSDETVNETLKNTTNEIVSAAYNPDSVITNIIDEKTKEEVSKAVASGKTISTEVQVEEKKENQIAKEDRKEVEKLVEEVSKTNKTTATVCQYLDLSVLIKSDDDSIGNIKELNKEIEFKVALPKDLLKTGRKFYVVRVHDGKAEKLETTLNEDGTLTFKTNKFSTYAVVYEDAKEVKAVEVEDKGNTETTIPTTTAKAHETKASTKTEAKKVKTGDESKTMLYVELGLMAIVGCAILFLQNKKDQLLNK